MAFFAVGTVFMIFLLGLFISIALFLYYIGRKILFVTRAAEKSVNTFTILGEGIANTLALKAKQLMTPKKAS